METREMLIEELIKKGSDINTIIGQLNEAKENLEMVKVNIKVGEEKIKEINKLSVMYKMSPKVFKEDNAKEMQQLKEDKVWLIESLKDLYTNHDELKTWRKDMYKAIKKFLTKDELKLIK